MTITLQLKPEVESALADRAKAKGLPLDAYLLQAIETLAKASATVPVNASDFRMALDRLAEMGRALPHQPSSAFARERIYDDHT